MENLNFLNTVFSLEGKVVVITGGYGYLGKAMTNALSKAGAIVYVLGRSQARFDECEFSKNVLFSSCDISKTHEVKTCLKSIFDVKGQIHCLVNNAFFMKMGDHPEEISDENWNFSMEGLLNSIYRCIREVIPYLRKTEGSKSIVNISSMYGIVAPDFDIYNNQPESFTPPFYGVAKAGVIQLTKYFAAYLAKNRINVNCISPGPFPNTKNIENKEFLTRLKKNTLLNRIGEPDDLIGIIIFLCGSSSSYITGQNLIIDGGWTVK